MAKHHENAVANYRQPAYWQALALAVLLTLLAGALYGKYSQRWGPPVDLTRAAAQLEKLSDELGDWKLVEELPMSDTTTEMLQCAGYVNRRYVNERTGQAVYLAMIVGPAGPTAVHTPEICYSSRAYDATGERRRVVLNSHPTGAHSFWTLDFLTKNPLADDLRVYYAWSRGRSWEASDSPRYEFAAEPLLYKIQLASTIRAGQRESESDACREFLDELLKADWATKTNG